MEWLLLALTGGGGGAYVAQRLRARRVDRRRRTELLEGSRRLAEEDVTVLGEQLRQLGLAVTGLALDEETRTDYQQALDAYETAVRMVPRLRAVDEIPAVVDTLEGGRYAVACVRSRVAGRRIPERRAACFFNPQHGPSTRDVVWTPPRHGTRTVAACDQCAARVWARDQIAVRPGIRRARPAPTGDTAAALARSRRPFALGVAAAGVGLAWSFDPRDGLDGWG